MPFIKNRIFLNAGHSLTDPGTSREERVESKIVMRIRDILVIFLKYNRFNVEVVPDNLNLRKTIDWINERAKRLDDGIAFALHINAGGGHGAEVWYYKDNNFSKELGQEILDSYTKKVGMRSRGVKSSSTSSFKTLGFVDQTNCWAILIEMGFIGNKEDMAIVADYEKNARALAIAICKVFSIPYRDKKLTQKEKMQITIFSIMRMIEELIYKLFKLKKGRKLN